MRTNLAVLVDAKSVWARPRAGQLEFLKRFVLGSSGRPCPEKIFPNHTLPSGRLECVAARLGRRSQLFCFPYCSLCKVFHHPKPAGPDLSSYQSLSHRRRASSAGKAVNYVFRDETIEGVAVLTHSFESTESCAWFRPTEIRIQRPVSSWDPIFQSCFLNCSENHTCHLVQGPRNEWEDICTGNRKSSSTASLRVQLAILFTGPL